MPIAKVGYDAERELGIVADNRTDAVALRNSRILTDVLWNQKPSGTFRFTDRSAVPVLNDIYFQAKEYYFADTIYSPPFIGGGFRSARRARSYSYPTVHYSTAGLLGGARTRFTAIDGDDSENFLSIAGHGFMIDGIEFRSRPYDTDSTGEGPTEGTRKATCIIVEGREFPATGGHSFSNCGFIDFDTAIYAKAGYYDFDGETYDDIAFVDDENHGDNCEVKNCMFWNNVAGFYSDNQQAVNWNFHNPRVSGYGGDGQRACTFIEVRRGGSIKITGILDITNLQMTLFKVYEWSPYTNSLECDYLKWDWMPSDDAYIRLFDYAGTAYPDSSFLKWRVRIGGHLPLTGNAEFDNMDISGLFRVRTGSVNFPLNNVLCDIENLPQTNMTQVGTHWYPTSYLDWTY